MNAFLGFEHLLSVTDLLESRFYFPDAAFFFESEEVEVLVEK